MALDGIVGRLREPIRARRIAVSKLSASAVGQVYLEPMDAVPTVATVEGRIAWDGPGNGLVQSDGVQYRHLSDRLLIRTNLDAASVDKWLFVADRAYKVLGFREIHSVVGSTSAAVRPRKVTAAGTDAPGAAAGATVKELTTASVDLTATINVAQTPTNTATAADLLLAAGDKVGLDFSGTLTGLVGELILFLEQV